MGAQAEPEQERDFDPYVAPPRPQAPAYPAPLAGGEIAFGSPALELQQAIAAEFASETNGKWPPIATLAFIAVTCGGFWAVVALAALRLR